MLDTEPTSPAPIEPSKRADLSEQAKWDAAWADERGRYEVERTPLKATELESEKNLDNLIVALATSAIGASVVIAKDLFSSSAGLAFAILSWIFCGISLGTALLDRYWTYTTHKKWRSTMDTAMKHETWRPGAFDHVEKVEYDKIPFIHVVPKLKVAALASLGVGIFFLLIFLGVSAANRTAPSPPAPINVNIYTTTQPTVTMP